MNQTVQYLQSVSSHEEIEASRIVNCLLLDAVAAGATDIHIEPWENSLAVRIRLNGVLNELAHLPLDVMDRLLQRVKVMANLVSYQTDLPQEGHVAADEAFGGVELRVSYVPTVRGGKMVLRIFDPGSRSFDLGALGLDDDVREKLVHLLARPGGLLLLTGPTGSGKTTTIYSALVHLTQRFGPAISVSTLEDPVECWLPMLSQSQINPARDFAYPVALRSLLRQDPQVIMVGEIRDPETATIALQAGLTGHLVISTIHSGSATGVFARLINMAIEPFLLASSVIGAMGQRLIRRNCEACMQPYEPDAALLKYLPAEAHESAYFRRGVGCAECRQTGFSRRVALAELLVVNEVFRDAILQRLSTSALQKVAIEQGIQTLWSRGLQRVMAGQIPLEELLRVVAPDSV
jgi:type II secretory ATPase GspE/PulE/Tfp pilus assembly ATPase PilB-like protein